LSAAILVPMLLLGSGARAELRADSVHTAQAKKSGAYVRDGVVTGGDQAVTGVVVRDIRRAPNAGFERIVIDLQGNRDGEPVAIERPPYYQVSVNPDEKRLIFTVWGKPKLAFDSKRVLAAFRKSASILNLTLLPLLEPDSWTFVAELKSGSPIEVFELSNPVRIIIDVRTSAH
jgi:hypothetical protein